jgi:4-diphosphocytidyl-2C-methyl-D-erythritol kinase
MKEEEQEVWKMQWMNERSSKISSAYSLSLQRHVPKLFGLVVGSADAKLLGPVLLWTLK